MSNDEVKRLRKALELSIENNHAVLANLGYWHSIAKGWSTEGHEKPGYAAGCICVDYWLEQADEALKNEQETMST